MRSRRCAVGPRVVIVALAGRRGSGALLAAIDRMRHKKQTPSRKEEHGHAGSTPPSVSDELMDGDDPGELFTDDGRKTQDIERVGAMSPDTDPPDTGVRTYPADRKKPRGASRTST